MEPNDLGGDYELAARGPRQQGRNRGEGGESEVLFLQKGGGVQQGAAESSERKGGGGALDDS